MDIMYSWLLPLTLVIAFYGFLIWKKSSMGMSSHIVLNLPPGPPRLPIIGNLHHLYGKNIHKILWKLSEKYGPIVSFRMGSQPYVLISSSELATQVLRTHDDTLCTRPYSRTLKRLSFEHNDIAFTPYGDQWKKRRTILVTDILSGKKTKLFKKVLDLEIKNMLSSLSSHAMINLEEKIKHVVTDVACKIVVGKSYREVTFMGKTMMEILHDQVAFIFSRSYSEIFPKYGWILEDLSGWSRKLDKYMKEFDGILEMMINEHIDNTSEDDQDLVDIGKPLFNRPELKAVISAVLSGAIDTTSLTAVWIMSAVVKNPRVMHKLQDEIRRCTGDKSQVEESDIAKMNYLKMVIKEGLRLHIPTPMLLPRESMSHITIGGYDIPRGTNVLINSWVIARDTKVWTENANEFYPERFENFVVNEFEMTPFGGGRRSCPGYRLSTSLVEILIANLLHCYDWKLPSGQNQDLDMEVNGNMLLCRRTPLCLVPIKVT